MTKKQRGFSAIEVILVVLVLGLVGVIGWLVWSRQTTPPTTSSSSSSSSSSTASEQPAVKITEWGVKVNTSHASALTYTVKNESGEVGFDGEGGDQYDAFATFTVHDNAITDPDCSSPAGFMYRIKGSPRDLTQAIQINGRYYELQRPNGPCSDDTSTTTRDKLIEDLKIQNIKAL